MNETFDAGAAALCLRWRAVLRPLTGPSARSLQAYRFDVGAYMVINYPFAVVGIKRDLSESSLCDTVVATKGEPDVAGREGWDHLPQRIRANDRTHGKSQDEASNAPQPRGDVATQGVAQTNENHERMSAAAAEAARLMKNTYSTRSNGTQAYSTKVLEFVQVNTDAAFEYVRQLSSVKSQAEFFALSNDRVRQQFEVLFRQAQELTAIARKVTVATTEPVKPGVNKAV